MKFPFNGGAPSFDANAVNETIQRALASAGLDTTLGPMRDVTETIRRALAAGRIAEAGPKFDRKAVVDVEARVLPAGGDGGATPGHVSGSYTDGAGPDASAEMVRFFLALPRCGLA
jgi:hypothetical protein